MTAAQTSAVHVLSIVARQIVDNVVTMSRPSLSQRWLPTLQKSPSPGRIPLASLCANKARSATRFLLIPRHDFQPHLAAITCTMPD